MVTTSGEGGGGREWSLPQGKRGGGENGHYLRGREGEERMVTT